MPFSASFSTYFQQDAVLLTFSFPLFLPWRVSGGLSGGTWTVRSQRLFGPGGSLRGPGVY